MSEPIWPPGTPGLSLPFPIPDRPVKYSEISQEHWDFLKSYGWYEVTENDSTSLWPPPRPMVTSPIFGSASAQYNPNDGPSATIPEYSRDGIRGKWRYIAQRATTGQFLDFDLPLSRDELTWELSGPGCLRATITPERATMKAEDGRLLLEEWGTFIFAEAGGEIRWGGILINSGWNGETWELECAGFSAYPNGQPYGSEYSQTGVDPGDVFRHIWLHLQSYFNGDLGVRVTGTYTGQLIGLPTGPVLPVQVSGRVYQHMMKLGWTTRQGDSSQRIYPPDYDGDVPPNPNSNQDPLEPYELLWWEAPDCGQALNTLVTDTPMDYVERHAWDENAPYDAVKHEIQLYYPRCGRRRFDLAFIQGDNVTSVVSPQADGDYFANAVMGLGAGEGSGSIRRTTATADGRLRRAYVYTAKDVSNESMLDRMIENEMRRRQLILTIDQIEVIDHPNAPIGSWALGDDILVRAVVPWLGEIELWCRITGWSLTSDTTATLKLARSDSFSYAAPEIAPEEGPVTGNTDEVPYPASTTFPAETLYPNDPQHKQGE